MQFGVTTVVDLGWTFTESSIWRTYQKSEIERFQDCLAHLGSTFDHSIRFRKTSFHTGGQVQCNGTRLTGGRTTDDRRTHA